MYLRSFKQSMVALGAAISRIWLLPLYLLGGLLPRRNDLWVFGSWGGRRFADNSAAFFEYCRANLDDGTRLVWISHRFSIVRQVREQGGTAYWFWSPRGIVCCLRARLHLFDCFAKDINFWLCRGAILVNLWSGVPLKTFERDIDNPGNRYYRLFHGSLPERLMLAALMPWHIVKPDLIIATSPETREITRRAFDVPAEHVAITGYPRNDRLLEPVDDNTPPDMLKTPLSTGKKLILYLPTFRDSGLPFTDFDWSRMDRLLEEINGHLIIKFHPVDPSRLDGHFRNIEVSTRQIDVYNLLPFVSALISDYSSIIWDYMLLKKPIIYFTPDLREFVSTSRALNFDVQDIAVGPVCETFDQLIEAVRQLDDGSQPGWVNTEHGQRILKRFHSYTDPPASARVLAAIRRCIDEQATRARQEQMKT